jgi:hypothetical protein
MQSGTGSRRARAAASAVAATDSATQNHPRNATPSAAASRRPTRARNQSVSGESRSPHGLGSRRAWKG